MNNIRSRSVDSISRVRTGSPIRSGSPGRLNFTAKQKVLLANLAEATSPSEAANTFGVTRMTAYRAITNKNLLQAIPSTRIRLSGGGRKSQFPAECEFELYNEIIYKNELKEKVDYDYIRSKATKILDKYLREHSDKKDPGLKFSDGWIRKLMIKRRLSCRIKTNCAQDKKIDIQKQFQLVFDYLCRLNRQAKAYLLSQIRNMDETPVYLDAPSNRTIVPVGTKSVSLKDTGNAKNRFTVCLHISAAGVMHEAVVIIKRKTIPLKWKIPFNLRVFANEKSATMSEVLMRRYTLEHLIPSFNGMPGYFLNDEFSGHKTEEIIKLLMDNNINPIFILAGCTSYLQPLDLAINAPFKHHYSKCWQSFINSKHQEVGEIGSSDEEEDENDHAYTKGGNRRRPSWPLVLSWVSYALCQINSETIKLSFIRCGLLTGDWQSFEHLNETLKSLIKPVDDWDAEEARVNNFNEEVKEKSEKNLLNVDSIIATCSQENFVGSELPPKPTKRAYNKKKK